MIYRLQNKDDFTRYIVDTMPIVDNTPEIGQVGFDKETGIVHARCGGTHRFELAVPISNLKIGDIVKVECMYKHINGIAPTLNNTFLTKNIHNTGTNSGGIVGSHRLRADPNIKLKDFQKVEIIFVYEGLNDVNSVSFSNESSGIVYVRLLMPEGYGASEFMFRDFKITTDHAINGLYPATRIYHDTLQFDSTEKKWSLQGKGSHNFGEFKIEIIEDAYVEIHFGQRFRYGASVFLHTSYQGSGNDYRYSVSENTITQTYLRCVVINNETNAITRFSDIDKNIYCNLMIIGE